MLKGTQTFTLLAHPSSLDMRTMQNYDHVHEQHELRLSAEPREQTCSDAVCFIDSFYVKIGFLLPCIGRVFRSDALSSEGDLEMFHRLYSFRSWRSCCLHLLLRYTICFLSCSTLFVMSISSWDKVISPAQVK